MRFFSCAVFVLAIISVANAGDLEWSDHYANAKQGAASEQRPLLVVLENSADPAGRLDLASVNSTEQQTELMKHFKLCRMDVSTPYGKRVAEAFGASKFPFTAITDKTTRYVTYRSSENLTGDQWAQALESRKNGDTPVVAVEQSTQRFEAAKIITGWPTIESPARSNCPNCVLKQYYR